jgi:hypothetical protein
MKLKILQFKIRATWLTITIALWPELLIMQYKLKTTYCKFLAAQY